MDIRQRNGGDVGMGGSVLEMSMRHRIATDYETVWPGVIRFYSPLGELVSTMRSDHGKLYVEAI